MKSKVSLGVLGGFVLAIVMVMCAAWNNMPNIDTLFPAPVLFTKTINVQTEGSLQIAGTAVSSSAAELNILDGCTATYAQLNSAASGNIAYARITNALKSVASGAIAIDGTNMTASAAQLNAAAATVTTSAGDLTSGNLALARMTNALPSAGSYIGGNIPVASLTNAITSTTGVYITNTCIAADAKTNTYVFAPIGGRYVLHSISTSP